MHGLHSVLSTSPLFSLHALTLAYCFGPPQTAVLQLAHTDTSLASLPVHVWFTYMPNRGHSRDELQAVHPTSSQMVHALDLYSCTLHLVLQGTHHGTSFLPQSLLRKLKPATQVFGHATHVRVSKVVLPWHDWLPVSSVLGGQSACVLHMAQPSSIFTGIWVHSMS